MASPVRVLLIMLMKAALWLLPRLQRAEQLLPIHPHPDYSQINSNLLKVLAAAFARLARVVLRIQIHEAGAGEDVLRDDSSQQVGAWLTGRGSVGVVGCAVEVLWATEDEDFVMQMSDQVVHDVVLERNILEFIAEEIQLDELKTLLG